MILKFKRKSSQTNNQCKSIGFKFELNYQGNLTTQSERYISRRLILAITSLPQSLKVALKRTFRNVFSLIFFAT
jgi:hypothetical protein